RRIWHRPVAHRPAAGRSPSAECHPHTPTRTTPGAAERSAYVPPASDSILLQWAEHLRALDRADGAGMPRPTAATPEQPIPSSPRRRISDSLTRSARVLDLAPHSNRRIRLSLKLVTATVNSPGRFRPFTWHNRVHHPHSVGEPAAPAADRR